MALYDIFQGNDLKVAEKIQQRRIQMLVHSYIYYDLDNNVVSDETWTKWARELAQLQRDYPEIEKQVPYREGFEDWDASTGAFLPYHTEYVKKIASRLLGSKARPKTTPKPVQKQKSPVRRKLF